MGTRDQRTAMASYAVITLFFAVLEVGAKCD